MSLRFVVYPLFALFCLVLFSFFLFPFESLKGRIEGEIEKGMGGRFSVSVEKLSPALFTGVTLKGVAIKRRGEEKGATLDRARIKVSLLPLLWGTRRFKVGLRSGRGRVNGTLAFSSESTEMDLEIEEMDLSLGALFLPKTLPFSGAIDGSMDLLLYPQDPFRSAGKVLLDIRGLKLDEGASAAGFPIPAVTLAEKGARPGGASPVSDSRLEIDVNRGNWEVRSFRLVGGDLVLEANGKIFAQRQAKNYRLSLKGSFEVPPGHEEKLPFLSLIESQKEQGKYPFAITGRLTKPSIRIGTFKVPI